MRSCIMLMLSLASSPAQAKTMAFACQFQQWDVIFATTVDSRAVEISRFYAYDDNTDIQVRIVDLKNSQVWADFYVTENVNSKEKTYAGKGVCQMETL